MAKANFSFEASSPEPGITVYTLTGRLYGYKPCWDFLEEIRDNAENLPACVFDMAGIEFADSTGVGVLVAAYTSLRNAGGKLVLAGMNERVRTILDVLWFLKLLDHAENLEDAIAMARAKP